jgi:hypothetical protein
MGAAVQGIDQAEYSDILDARLYLPSELSPDDVTRYGLQRLVSEETSLREAQLFKLLAQLRRSVTTISAANRWKQADARGQGPNTKAQERINALQNEQIVLLQFYNSCVDAMPKLDSGPEFSRLTQDDLKRKLTVHRREVGSSKQAEGRLYHRPGRADTSVGRAQRQLDVVETEDGQYAEHVPISLLLTANGRR